MSKFRLSAALLLLFLSSSLAWMGVAHAQSFMSQTDSSQNVDSSLYSFSKNVDVEGTINGDVYCGGQNVTIDATVHGDVICAGQTVTINGHVDGSVRVVAETFTDGAYVGRSFSAAAQSATITKGARVGGDVSFIGSELAVNGRVGRDIAARASTMNINGIVGRNVKYSGTTLHIWSKAHIAGGLDYSEQQSAMISRAAVVHGGIEHTIPTPTTSTKRQAIVSWAGSFLYFFGAMLLFGLLVVLLMPQVVRSVSEESASHLGKTSLNGLGLLILEPIILIILCASLVGVPLAAICVLLFVLIGITSVPITAYYVGSLIMSRHDHALLIMTVGMFVVILLLTLPFIGIFAAIASLLIGTGGIVLALRKYIPTPVYKVK